MCTLTVESDGSLFFGGNIYEAVETLAEMGADAVGINCSTGPDQLLSVVENMRKKVSVPLIVKPNAGMPVIDEMGNPVYSMGAEDFASQAIFMKQWRPWLKWVQMQWGLIAPQDRTSFCP